jgi:hypothetical protein
MIIIIMNAPPRCNADETRHLPAIFLFEIGTQLQDTRAWVMTCQVSHWGIWGKRTDCRIGHGVVRREGCGFIIHHRQGEMSCPSTTGIVTCEESDLHTSASHHVVFPSATVLQDKRLK